MDSETQNTTTQSPIVKKRHIWQWLGGDSLAISIGIHGILLVLGIFWVFKIIPPPPEKTVDFAPSSGGGQSSQVQTKVKPQQVTRPNMARVVANGAVSNFVLPEPEELNMMASVGGLSSGSLSAGIGGGKGLGKGPGVGNGLLPGMSDGGGSKNPFGMIQLNKNALVGTFYDLKQTKDRKPTKLNNDQVRDELHDIVKKGLKEQDLKKYYQSPNTLYQTQFLIPTMKADKAPAAFECQNEVQPQRWVIVYRGAVEAPKSGRFRFVGAADDVLVVRFDGKTVFDFGYTVTGTKGLPRDRGKLDEAAFKKLVSTTTPMTYPYETYKYQQTHSYNGSLGGMALGPIFEVKAGASYPIEILVAEIPGGFFSAALLIEEIGARYKKLENGSPLLPLFQVGGVLPEVKPDDEAPPFAQDGLIWNVSKSAPKIGI